MHTSISFLAAAAVAAIVSQPSTALAQPAPDLRIAMTDSGNFTVGVNGIYSIVVSNVGGTASSGPISVSDVLNPNPFPTNLGFVSATGTGWTCGAAFGFPSDHVDVSCESSSVIASGGSAASIFLTVRPFGAAGTVTNTACFFLTSNCSSDVTLVSAGVPTLPQGALIALTALLAWAGVVALRRRRRGPAASSRSD
jgi:hypothetical protein